jgi:hypothetical protein
VTVNIININDMDPVFNEVRFWINWMIRTGIIMVHCKWRQQDSPKHFQVPTTLWGVTFQKRVIVNMLAVQEIWSDDNLWITS